MNSIGRVEPELLFLPMDSNRTVSDRICCKADMMCGTLHSQKVRQTFTLLTKNNTTVCRGVEASLVAIPIRIINSDKAAYLLFRCPGMPTKNKIAHVRNFRIQSYPNFKC